MQLIAVILTGLVLAASQVASAIVERRSALGVLLARQATTTNVCATTCASFEAPLESCTTVACFCTGAVAESLQECINCALNADPTATAITDARTVLDEYDAICLGVNLPTITIPNVVASSTSPSPGGTTAGAVFPFGTSFAQQTLRTTSTASTGTTKPSTTQTSPAGQAGGSSTFKNGFAVPLLISVGAVLGINLL
ncbi:hypothetical protein BJ912DRAFT_954255 [Pholiota molesta]|nr:hypothetical protein BJ912DRAFT_954255 [Pholiota molesta]